jgi:hypothetical protein
VTLIAASSGVTASPRSVRRPSDWQYSGIAAPAQALAAAPMAAPTHAAELVADTVWVPLMESPPLAAPRELRLETFLYRPASARRPADVTPSTITEASALPTWY